MAASLYDWMILSKRPPAAEGEETPHEAGVRAQHAADPMDE